MKFTAKQIADYIHGEIVGNENVEVHSFAKIEEGHPGCISFLANPKYTEYIYTSQSSIILVNRDFTAEQPVKATLIKVDNAYESLARLMTLYAASQPRKKGISPLAFISSTATVGSDVYIAPFAVIGDHATVGSGCEIHEGVSIGDNASVGNDCIFYSNATLYHDCHVSNRCILHSGCSIGADGFGFAPGEDGYEKIPQLGVVMLEDDVEIGANACIDRATMEATIIHKGVKIDNLVQIAHNVEVGSNTVMAAQTGIAGSTKVGEWCMFGGQTGAAGHIKIGDRVTVAAQSGIIGNMKGGETLLGSPAIDARQFITNYAYFKRLSELNGTVKELKKEIEELKKIMNEHVETTNA